MVKRRPADTGQRAEAAAEAFLKTRGLKLISRNFRCKTGEIDLIMRERNVLVFIEVRYRASSRYGGGAASVTYAKQKRLTRAAEKYLQQSRNGHLACRFDVIAASPGKTHDEPFNLAWIKDAFQAA